jgi:hypothetical protein
MELPTFNWLVAAASAPWFDILEDCAAFAELLESTCAPDLSAGTEVLCEAEALVCEAAEVCATAVPKSKVPTKLRAAIRFIKTLLKSGNSLVTDSVSTFVKDCRTNAVLSCYEGLAALCLPSHVP